jgi:RNA polymerase sigma-70 factor (ECF subfamily)
MRAVRSSDVAALDTLMRRHWHRLFQYVARCVDRADDAEDVTQEVFVRLWESRTTWRTGGSAQAYIYRIARNLLSDRARHEEVRERSADEVRRISGRVPSPIESAVHGELNRALEKALGALAPRRREAFLLVRLQGLTLAEAAEAMELAPQTVANHVYLAAHDLAEALHPHLT